MKKIIKTISVFSFMVLISVCICACGLKTANECKTTEAVKLETVMLSEVEFKNSETVTLNQECDDIEISGTIDAMTAAQKSVYGTSDVTHVVALKITFDKERTISYFEIKGETTKVYSTNSEDLNYVGSISDLLDSESDEDAYCYLILSASTKEYELTSKYTDGTTSEIDVEIKATLLTAVED